MPDVCLIANPNLINNNETVTKPAYTELPSFIQSRGEKGMLKKGPICLKDICG